LSSATDVQAWRYFAVPCCGGAVLGFSTWLLARFRPGRIVDPVEANSLYGGRMSLRDSAVVALQTVWSDGIGGSVGMEAGYAQIGAGIASWFGRGLRLRRADLRLVVGCGAAAAIGGAFGAPLCGAFYGIELVIGTYSIATLPFVVIASLSGTIVASMLHGGPPPLSVTLPAQIPLSIYPVAIVLGVTSGLAAIVLMRGVTAVEAAFRKSAIPAMARPILGGLAVGVIGWLAPIALGSGHAALHLDINEACPLLIAGAYFFAKATASAISIGSGFRGGLFFASLFLGSLFGKAFGDVFAWIPILPTLPIGFYAVVGMSAVAVGVVGGPMTMTFLALESTNNFSITIAVLGAAITSAITVRRLFGFSFTTWRFHLRGEAIRSGADIGWVHNLTVGRMMTRNFRIIGHGASLKAFRDEIPLGFTKRVAVIDAEDRYAGMVLTHEAYVPLQDDALVGEILHYSEDFLLPDMTVKEAISAFERAEADALAVVDSRETRQIVGILTEQYALRRYNEELEQRRRELFGE
jgi:CIC family chloride channel protein